MAAGQLGGGRGGAAGRLLLLPVAAYCAHLFRVFLCVCTRKLTPGGINQKRGQESIRSADHRSRTRYTPAEFVTACQPAVSTSKLAFYCFKFIDGFPGIISSGLLKRHHRTLPQFHKKTCTDVRHTRKMGCVDELKSAQFNIYAQWQVLSFLNFGFRGLRDLHAMRVVSCVPTSVPLPYLPRSAAYRIN